MTGLVQGVTTPLAWAAVSSPVPGETECGDLHVVRETSRGALVGVIDGLGHGAEAAETSRRAVAILREFAEDSLISLVRRCHRALEGTRGAVVTLARFDARDDTLSWISIGNVLAVLFRADGAPGPNPEAVLARPGILGGRLPALQAAILPVARGDVLIVGTDGLRPEFTHDARWRGSPHEVASALHERYGRRQDDALVLVAHYQGDTSAHAPAH